MPVLEYLAVKGLMVIGKAIAAKGLAAKAGLLLWKMVGAYGLSATIGNTLLIGVVVGGIYWTKDRVDNLSNGLKAIEDGDIKKAVLNFGQLAISSNIEVEMLPDAVHDYLLKINVSEEKASAVAKVVSSLETNIANEVMRLK